METCPFGGLKLRNFWNPTWNPSKKEGLEDNVLFKRMMTSGFQSFVVVFSFSN